MKLDGVVDSVPPDEDFEVLDGKINDEEWDRNGNENVADSDNTHKLIKWGGGQYKVL